MWACVEQERDNEKAETVRERNYQLAHSYAWVDKLIVPLSSQPISCGLVNCYHHPPRNQSVKSGTRYNIAEENSLQNWILPACKVNHTVYHMVSSLLDGKMQLNDADQSYKSETSQKSTTKWL